MDKLVHGRDGAERVEIVVPAVWEAHQPLRLWGERKQPLPKPQRDDVIALAMHHFAWNTLVDQPWKIMSIACREWATVGYCEEGYKYCRLQRLTRAQKWLLAGPQRGRIR